MAVSIFWHCCRYFQPLSLSYCLKKSQLLVEVKHATMNDSLTSDFSKVKFHEIPESYGIAETVTFEYTIASSLEPTTSDWIGLYRVGWKSTKEYVTYEWISLPDNYTPGTQVECVCTFKDNLPKNDEDFFQFCYINSRGKVCGASSPFQFLEDYDIVVISETESMLIVETNTGPSKETNTGPSKQPTTTATTQHQQPCTDELVIVEDEVQKMTGELMETKKLLVEKDSQLKDLASEVNELQSKLRQSEDMSSQLAEDVDRLKSELLDEKEKQILMEKTFSESEKHHQKTLLKFSERELAYKEKEMQLNASLQEMQKQLCQKAQELELLKMEHSSNLSVLQVKHLAVEELMKRCSKMSAEIIQTKKAIENVSKLEMMWKEKAAMDQEQIRHLQAASKDEKRTNQVVLEKQVEFHRNTANGELVADGVENLTRATAEGGEIPKESSVDRVETDSCSTDQFGDNNCMQSRKTCTVCFLTFPAGTSVEVFHNHLQSHQKVCPMCNKNFELNCTQDEFEMHVFEHLADTMTFTDGRKICPMCQLGFPGLPQEQFEFHVNQHFVNTLRPH